MKITTKFDGVCMMFCKRPQAMTSLERICAGLIEEYRNDIEHLHAFLQTMENRTLEAQMDIKNHAIASHSCGVVQGLGGQIDALCRSVNRAERNIEKMLKELNIGI
ncbi:MAG: hypothetical protein KAR40_05995 [Candidatus Sabulitectum sp.]|nr:hypothetical protein [Candidatus Sabulitectum sp.]